MGSAVIPDRGKDGIERGGELRIPVPDQVGEPAPGLCQFAGEVSGELCGPTGPSDAW